MAIDRCVIDASVAVKWFLDDEELIEAAEAVIVRFLSGELELHAPIILRYELAHALAKTQRRKSRPISTPMIVKAYETFSEHPIIFHDLDKKEMLQALDISCRFRRSFYDSAYICLAMKLGCAWLTADARYAHGLPRQFPADHVMVLS